MAAPESPSATLARLGLSAKKHFGQNFLADARIAARIAELATPAAAGTVVEIGAGLGALTRPLLARAGHVVAIERDRDMVPALRAEFAGEIAADRLSLIEADAKQADLAALLASGPEPRVLAGNLPYQITGPLLQRAVAIGEHLSRVVFLVQLEVADRLVAAPSTARYGALSVFVQARYAVRREFIVRRGAFFPQPGVDSAVVLLEPHTPPAARETEAFRSLVKGAFGQRRKKLRNAWAGVLGASNEELASAAVRAGIDLNLRGETLDVHAFSRMAEELSQ
jgi:16S rRNA (adenine1518-N6/adenine1519-N6)-dimethyltransferase